MATPGRSRAFTIIEVLAVVAIVAALAAICQPVQARSRAKAYGIADNSQLRQWSAGRSIYEVDSGRMAFPSKRPLVLSGLVPRILAKSPYDHSKNGAANEFRWACGEDEGDYPDSYLELADICTPSDCRDPSSAFEDEGGGGWLIAFQWPARTYIRPFSGKYLRLQREGSVLVRQTASDCMEISSPHACNMNRFFSDETSVDYMIK